MTRPVNDEEKLRKFGQKLELALIEQNVKQSDLARESGLDATVMSEMIAGKKNRLTRNYFLRCLRGLILLNICRDEELVEYWLRHFCEAKGIEYIPLEELGPQGEKLL